MRTQDDERQTLGLAWAVASNLPRAATVAHSAPQVNSASATTVVTTTATDIHGSFSALAMIPTTATVGTYAVVGASSLSSGYIFGAKTHYTVTAALPPDPSSVAPPLDGSVATPPFSATQFLYTGSNPIQTGVAPGTIEMTLGYDTAGRLSTLTTPQGQEQFSYDPATGQPITLTTPDGEMLTYGYDGSLVTAMAWTGAVAGSVDQSYDNNFRVISDTVDGANAIGYQYDADGYLIKAGTLSLAHDPQNSLLTGTMLGSITDTLGYNPLGQVTSYQAAVTGTNAYAVQYVEDAGGSIMQKTETLLGATHTITYTYDLAHRLTDVSEDGASVSHYTYDANGNRLSATTSSGTITAAYDNQDRLQSYGTTSYTYTPNGEVQSKTDTTSNQTTSYVYDALGNLTGVALPNGTHITYLVDGANRRIGKEINGVLVQGFLYGDGRTNPIAEVDGHGNIVARFVYASSDQVPDYMITGGGIYRLIYDDLGSPRVILDTTTGQVVQRLDYDVFGNVAVDTNPGFQPFGFAGGLYDPDTELVHFGARDYDAATGRWTSKDPTLFGGGQANLYTYVDDDPVNLRDPNGLDPVNDAVRNFESQQLGPVPEASQWVVENSPLATLGHLAEYALANIFAQVGATIGQAAITPFELAFPNEFQGLRGETLWGVVQDAFNNLYRETLHLEQESPPWQDQLSQQQQEWLKLQQELEANDPCLV